MGKPILSSPGTGRKNTGRKDLTPRSGAGISAIFFPMAHAMGYDLSLLRSLARNTGNVVPLLCRTPLHYRRAGPGPDQWRGSASHDCLVSRPGHPPYREFERVAVIIRSW